MRSVPSISILLATAALVLLGTAGCDDDDVLDPRFEPEVANNTDSFQFQATGVNGVTQTLTYVCRNTGTQANVDQSCALTGGTASLVLSDSTGTQLYAKSLSENGSFTSSAGQAGNWTIRVVLDDVKGTLNFRVQKST